MRVVRSSPEPLLRRAAERDLLPPQHAAGQAARSRPCRSHLREIGGPLLFPRQRPRLAQHLLHGRHLPRSQRRQRRPRPHCRKTRRPHRRAEDGARSAEFVVKWLPVMASAAVGLTALPATTVSRGSAIGRLFCR